MQQLWNWSKADGCNSEDDTISGADWCEEFEKDLWFELRKCMWSKHLYVFKVGIIHYAKHVHDMHDLDKLLPLYLKKGDDFDQADWKVCNKEFS